MTVELELREAAFFERDVRLRMPFRFGVVTLTTAPQAFVRARVRLADGREGEGWAAELLVPKWFDKSPHLSNEENFDQLRRSLALAAAAYRGQPGFRTPFGLHAAASAEVAQAAQAAGLPDLVAGFGPALLDRAMLDAVLRLTGTSVFAAARDNLFGLDASLTPDLGGFDLPRFLAGLGPNELIHVRHTVGLADPLTADDLAVENRVGDGLPETLEEVIRAYSVTHFKLKVGGDLEADLDRLTQIAAILDMLPDYRVTLDGNEQYANVDGALALWEAIGAAPELGRLCQRVLFVEQPIVRTEALERDIADLARLTPVEIDESDAELDAFVRARELGYTGVSSKSCKGFYRSLLNRARCAAWNDGAGARRYFMSAEDLTTQAGLAVQQDLALAGLIGCSHVERNGHHYVNGMAAAPEAEQTRFLEAHPDLYHRRHGAVRLDIRDGALRLGSRDGAGLASGALPDVAALEPRDYGA